MDHTLHFTRMNVVARYRMDPHFFQDAPHAVDEMKVTFLVRKDRRLTVGVGGISYDGFKLPSDEITSLTWGNPTARLGRGEREFGFLACTPTAQIAVAWKANDTLEGFFRGVFQRTSGEQPLAARCVEQQQLAFDVVTEALRKFIVPSWILRQKYLFAQGQSLKVGSCLFDAFGAHFDVATSSGSLPVSLLWSELRVTTNATRTFVSAVYDDQVAVSFPTSSTANACILPDLWMEQLPESVAR